MQIRSYTFASRQSSFRSPQQADVHFTALFKRNNDQGSGKKFDPETLELNGRQFAEDLLTFIGTEEEKAGQETQDSKWARETLDRIVSGRLTSISIKNVPWAKGPVDLDCWFHELDRDSVRRRIPPTIAQKLQTGSRKPEQTDDLWGGNSARSG